MMSVRESFDSAAAGYDKSRKALIPDYTGFYGAALAALPEDRKKAYRILDLGAGTGRLSRLVGKAYPHAEIIVSDFAPSMLERAREKLGEDRRYRFERIDMLLDRLPEDLDAVVSSLAIHHLDHCDKRMVFSRIFKALKPGGRFVNADQLSSGEIERDRKRFDKWLSEVRASGVCEKELSAALERMSAHDKNAPKDLQLRWLTLAGFSSVELVYRKYFFGVFKAVK